MNFKNLWESSPLQNNEVSFADCAYEAERTDRSVLPAQRAVEICQQIHLIILAPIFGALAGGSGISDERFFRLLASMPFAAGENRQSRFLNFVPSIGAKARIL